MIVPYGFTVATAAGDKKYHDLGIVDLANLQELFPDNVAWDVPGRRLASPIKRIEVYQARALYEALVAHLARNEVSHESYESGGFVDFPFSPVMSDLEGVFLDLIEFFETEVGFECPTSLKTVVDAKRQARKVRTERATTAG